MAETKCKTCQEGYVLIKAGSSDTIGVCTPSETCKTFKDAYTKIEDAICTGCKSGFLFVISTAGV